MRTLLLTILLSLLCFLGLAQENILQNYHKTAVDSSPALQSIYKKYEMALEQAPQVSALPDPALSFAYGIIPVETRLGPQIAKFSLTQMFPWFGTLNAKKQRAALQAHAAYEEYVSQRNKLVYDVSTVWYNLYFISRSITNISKQIELLKMLIQQANIKFENDQASMVDVLRFQMASEELEAKAEALKDQKKTTIVKLNMLLNRNATTEVITIDSLSMPEQQLYVMDSLIQNNPRLKALEASSKATEHQIEAARKSGFPSIGLGLDYSLIGKRTDMEVEGNGTDVIMPMLSMSIPLYRKKYSAKVNQAVLNHERISYKKQAVRNSLISEYEKATQDYNDAVRNMKLYNSLLEKANKAFHILQAAYITSGKDYDQLLEIQNSILKYQISYDKAISKSYIAMAYLDYLVAK